MVMHRMNAILDVDMQNLTATVQPGIITKQFIEHMESLGLFYPPDPSSMAISTIGGNIAECSGGLTGFKIWHDQRLCNRTGSVLASGEIHAYRRQADEGRGGL